MIFSFKFNNLALSFIHLTTLVCTLVCTEICPNTPCFALSVHT